MKRIISGLLTVLLVLGILPSAQAAAPSSGLKILYKDRDISLKTHEIDMVADKEIKLRAASGNLSHSEEVVWNSSDESIATVDKNGVLTVKNENGGTVNISCRASDGSGRSSGTRLVLLRKVHKVSLEHYQGLTVRAQSIITLKPKFFAPDGTEYTPTDPQLRWEIYSGNEHAFFSNDVSGTLCTNAVSHMETVRVMVRSSDNPLATAVLGITVSPIIESVRIINNGVDVSGREINSVTQAKILLTADCSPDQNPSAIKWSSSSSNITVSNGLVSANSPGRAIITAAATDGGGKSASVTVIFN